MSPDRIGWAANKALQPTSRANARARSARVLVRPAAERRTLETELELSLPMLMILVAMVLIALLQAGPVILSSGDIGDNYYDAPPAVILEQTTWLGLFIETGHDRKTRESHLAVTRVSFARREEAGPTALSTRHHSTRRGLLLSGVPRLSAGAAITVSQDIDLGGNKREAELWVGRRHYRIRPDSKEPNLPQLLRRKLLALQKAG